MSLFRAVRTKRNQPGITRVTFRYVAVRYFGFPLLRLARLGLRPCIGALLQDWRGAAERLGDPGRGIGPKGTASASSCQAFGRGDRIGVRFRWRAGWSQGSMLNRRQLASPSRRSRLCRQLRSHDGALQVELADENAGSNRMERRRFVMPSILGCSYETKSTRNHVCCFRPRRGANCAWKLSADI
jgi:hypothetical protein